MQPLSCRRCGTRVLVGKNSPAQTSVQWNGDSDGCTEFTERRAAHDPAPAVIQTCPRLRDSIEEAVRSGLLPVPTP